MDSLQFVRTLLSMNSNVISPTIEKLPEEEEEK